ncbi:hypothetical protein [Kitasatospora aureofaciens]|uniref:hypothetical protein n=1 Tax=Kitasatospora aureofaciens TaxID=1894 RepID=UPI0036F4A75B
MADMFPDTGQLRLANLATSGLVAFDVDQVATAWTLLVVALGPNCAALRGRPPDLELRAGTGLITTVPQAPSTATITDETGKPVGTASWTRDTTDVFTVQIDISSPDDRSWGLRITNTDPEELGFVWSSAKDVRNAQQPRVVLNPTALQTTVAVAEVPADLSVPISNIGTGPLVINGQADQDMGAGFLLKSFPTSLAPNACDHLQIGITGVTGAPDHLVQTATFVLDCNDPVSQEVTLSLSRVEKNKEHKDQKDVGKENKEDKDGKDKKDDKENKDAIKDSPPELGRLASPAGQPPEHFIPPSQRPDLADSALRDEPPEPGRPEG